MLMDIAIFSILFRLPFIWRLSYQWANFWLLFQSRFQIYLDMWFITTIVYLMSSVQDEWQFVDRCCPSYVCISWCEINEVYPDFTRQNTNFNTCIDSDIAHYLPCDLIALCDDFDFYTFSLNVYSHHKNNLIILLTLSFLIEL